MFSSEGRRLRKILIFAFIVAVLEQSSQLEELLHNILHITSCIALTIPRSCEGNDQRGEEDGGEDEHRDAGGLESGEEVSDTEEDKEDVSPDDVSKQRRDLSRRDLAWCMLARTHLEGKCDLVLF